jgi:hypothetical protein
VASWDVDEADIVVIDRYLVVNVEDVMLIRNSDMLNGSMAVSMTLIQTELVNCTITDMMIVLSCAERTQLRCAESTQAAWNVRSCGVRIILSGAAWNVLSCSTLKVLSCATLKVLSWAVLKVLSWAVLKVLSGAAQNVLCRAALNVLSCAELSICSYAG